MRGCGGGGGMVAEFLEMDAFCVKPGGGGGGGAEGVDIEPDTGPEPRGERGGAAGAVTVEPGRKPD